MRSISSAVAVIVLAVGHQSVHAQTDGAVSENALEEVVVTAERRSANLQSTAIAMTALNVDDLANKGVRDQTDLQFASPSLSMTQIGFTENANIRGIGINVQLPTVVSGVALYRDGLFYPGNILAAEPYYDVAAVEVLRGPQGTFVGQNSTGGAILVTSNSPVFDGTNGNVEAQVGSYENVRVRGAVNLPINDRWAARVAFNHESRDSFFDNLNSNHSEPGKIDQSNIRGSLLWQPNDSFSALWKNEFNINSTDGYPQRPIAGTAYASLAPANRWNLNYDRSDLRNDELSVRTGLELRYRFGNGVSIRSMSGFQYAHLNLLFDEDATAAPTTTSPLPGSYQPQVIHERVTTQEFNVLSPDSGQFRWIFGASYVHRDVPVRFNTFIQAPPGATVFTLGVHINNPSDAAGVFGQATYELTDALELQVGLRYSHDWIGSDGMLLLDPPGITLPNTASFSDHKVTGKVALNWQLNDDNFLYAFAAKGYKSGGPNIASPLLFQPETVWDYELGWKSTLLDGHLRTQLGVFYNSYDNFQSPVFNPQTTTTNVVNLQGSSKIRGIEAQIQGRARAWALDLGAAYVDSEIGRASLIDTRLLPNGGNGLGSQCPSGTASNPPVCFDYAPFVQDVSGSQNPYSPKFTANIGIQYQVPLFAGTITPRVDFAYIASQSTTVFNSPIDRLEVRHLTNAQLIYERDTWRVSAYGTNLTNQTYVAGQQGNNEFLGAPRQYGVRVAKEF